MKHYLSWYTATNITGHYEFPSMVFISNTLRDAEVEANEYEDRYTYKLASHTFILDERNGWAISMVFTKS